MEPHFDPVHLGGTLVATLAAIGILYWLLWTLLVYEGGIFMKLYALGLWLFGRKNLRELGYEGYPYALGAFEGWIGNLTALALCALAGMALYRLYAKAAAHKPR